MGKQGLIKEEYIHRKVRVICHDKTEEDLVGVLIDWTSALDNEPDGESITVQNEGGLWEAYVEDIKSIELI